MYLQVLLEHGVRQRLATGLPHDATLVDALDRASLAAGRRITRPLAARILAAAE